ncbi:MAG: alcohol dehydrogenase catalytic domain-containing protein [Rhodospirillales bacterium]
MKTRAAVLVESHRPKPYASSKPIRIIEIDLEPPGEGEVLVKMSAAGVCHSDLSVVNGTRVRHLPVVLGHEASGVVEEVGAGVKNFKLGDRVVFAIYHRVAIAVNACRVNHQIARPVMQRMQPDHY